MLEEEVIQLNNYINFIEEEWGGDIEFRQPVSEEMVNQIEKILDYKFPAIFRWFYVNKTNGLKINNNSILGINDNKNKKIHVENINRFNDPSKELYFKGRPHIFNDYVIIGYEHSTLVCLSKKYDFDNPLLYYCDNYNNSKGVDFFCMDINLEGFIKKMILDSFGDEDTGEWILK